VNPTSQPKHGVCLPCQFGKILRNEQLLDYQPVPVIEDDRNVFPKAELVFSTQPNGV